MRTHFFRSLFIIGMLTLLLPAASGLEGGASPPPQTQVPTPESVLGQPVGADFFLATYDESLAYFERLDAASDRLQLVEVGKTSFGAPWYLAVISSAANLRDLDRYREIAQRLAHPEGLSDAEARALAQEGKAIVHIDGGLHATEVAHAQHHVPAGLRPDHRRSRSGDRRNPRQRDPDAVALRSIPTARTWSEVS